MDVDTNDKSTDVEGTDSAKTDSSALQAQIDELTRLNNELKESMDEDRRKAYEKREQAKEEARKQSEEAGLFKEVNQELKSELQAKNEAIEKLNESIAANTAILNKMKEGMLEKVPKEIREEIKDLSFFQIEKIVKAIADNNIPFVDQSSTNPKKGLKTKSYNELTAEEKAQLAVDDPDHLKSLYKESRKDTKELI